MLKKSFVHLSILFEKIGGAISFLKKMGVESNMILISIKIPPPFFMSQKRNRFLENPFDVQFWLTAPWHINKSCCWKGCHGWSQAHTHWSLGSYLFRFWENTSGVLGSGVWSSQLIIANCWQVWPGKDGMPFFLRTALLTNTKAFEVWWVALDGHVAKPAPGGRTR